MLHFHADTPADSNPPAEGAVPYAEAVARLASIRKALHIVEMLAPGEAPPTDPGDELIKIAAAWPTATRARRRCFDMRSARTASVAAAGLEVLMSQRIHGAPASSASVEALAKAIRAGIGELEILFEH